MNFWERLVKVDSTSRKALEKVAAFKGNIGDYRGEAEVLEMLYAIDKRNIFGCETIGCGLRKTKKQGQSA